MPLDWESYEQLPQRVPYKLWVWDGGSLAGTPLKRCGGDVVYECPNEGTRSRFCPGDALRLDPRTGKIRRVRAIAVGTRYVPQGQSPARSTRRVWPLSGPMTHEPCLFPDASS